MESITFEIDSNSELKELFDSSVPHIFIHKFTPNETLQWWETNIQTQQNQTFKNLQVRGMEFDIQTNLDHLNKIIDLNTQQLRIYQFDKPIPDTLDLDRLPENDRLKILEKNGLQHLFWVDFERLFIYSNQKEFLNSIANKSPYKERIAELKNKYNT